MATTELGVSDDLQVVDLDELETRVLKTLGAVFEERRRRATTHGSEESLRRRAETAEQKLLETERKLASTSDSLDALHARVETLCVEHGSRLQQAQHLESENGSLRDQIAELRERVKVLGGEGALSHGPRKGGSLESDLFDIFQDCVGWDFEVSRVGQSQSKSMDLLLCERHPPEGRRPFVVRVECKHKKEVRTEDVDKFLRDVQEQDPDTAIFYSTCPLTSTMLARVKEDDRVVVVEERSPGERQSTILGAFAKAWGVALYRRFVGQDQASVEARFPRSLRSTLHTFKDAVVSAHAFMDTVTREVTQQRKRMRQSVMDAEAYEHAFLAEAEVDPGWGRHGPFDSLAAQCRRHGHPKIPRPHFLPVPEIAAVDCKPVRADAQPGPAGEILADPLHVVPEEGCPPCRSDSL